MYLRTWTDTELRRSLNVEPDNLHFVYEGSDRFRRQEAHADLPTDCGDAHCGFPDEDFASAIIKRLSDFADTLKGEQKRECLVIVGELQDLEKELSDAAQYGRSELCKVEDALAEFAEQSK